MTRYLVAALSVLLLSGAVQPAFAFSTEKGSDAFKGDASNFTDPDEIQPTFLGAAQADPSSK